MVAAAKTAPEEPKLAEIALSVFPLGKASLGQRPGPVSAILGTSRPSPQGRAESFLRRLRDTQSWDIQKTPGAMTDTCLRKQSLLHGKECEEWGLRGDSLCKRSVSAIAQTREQTLPLKMKRS